MSQRVSRCDVAAPPLPSGLPITPLIPINILDQNGLPVRNDNATSFAYVGPNDGAQQPPEVFYAYHPANPSDPSPIDPGETAQLKNAQTGKYCRILQMPAAYPLGTSPTGAAGRKARTAPPPSSRKARALQPPRPARHTSRGLLQTPSSCATQAIICDQDTIATATILTYTGSGMSYNGLPLVQSPVSKTLLLSSNPACTVPGGDKLSFPPAALSRKPQFNQQSLLPAARLPCARGMRPAASLTLPWPCLTARLLRIAAPPPMFQLGTPLTAAGVYNLQVHTINTCSAIASIWFPALALHLHSQHAQYALLDALQLGGACRIEGDTEYMVCSGQPKHDVPEQASLGGNNWLTTIGSCLRQPRALHAAVGTETTSLADACKLCCAAAAVCSVPCLCPVCWQTHRAWQPDAPEVHADQQGKNTIPGDWAH